MMLPFPSQVPGKSSDPLGEVPARNQADGAIRLSYKSEMACSSANIL